MHRSIDRGAAPEAAHGRLGRLPPSLPRPLPPLAHRPIHPPQLCCIHLSFQVLRQKFLTAKSDIEKKWRDYQARPSSTSPSPFTLTPPHLASPRPTSSYLAPPPSSPSVRLRPGGAAEGGQRTRSSGALSSRRAPVAGGKIQPQPLRLGLPGAPIGGHRCSCTFRPLRTFRIWLVCVFLKVFGIVSG